MANLPTPITGSEIVSDPREPLAALAEFYRAFNTGDLALMELNWDATGEVVMDNPLGGITRGWPGIRDVYARIFVGSARVRVALHEAPLQHHGEVDDPDLLVRYQRAVSGPAAPAKEET